VADLKFEQIAESIRRQVADGTLRPGDKIGSARELAEQWRTSRAPVNHAMDVLRAEGVIVTRQGKGAFVTDLPVARPAGRRGAGRTRVDGGQAFRRLGKPERRPVPEDVADAFGVPAGTIALHRARLMLSADGEPTSLVTAWFPADIADAAPLLSGTAPIAGGTTRHIASTTGRSPVKGRDVTTIRLAGADEADLLGLEPPCPVEVVVHTAFDQDGRALVCEVGVTPDYLVERVDEYPMGL